MVKEVALYPNSISVPLMSNFGVPENPKGMLHVRLLRMKSFKSADTFGKSDPYVVFEVGACALAMHQVNILMSICLMSTRKGAEIAAVRLLLSTTGEAAAAASHRCRCHCRLFFVDNQAAMVAPSSVI